MSGRGTDKVAKKHNVQPDRKRDNFEEFNKDQYEGELIKKEQHYKDCLDYIERLEKEIKRYQSIVPLEALEGRNSAYDIMDDIPSHKESMTEYLELILHNPLLQSYEQNVRSLQRDLETMESNYQNLKLDLHRSIEENEDLRELLVKKTKELNRALEGNGSIPLPNETERERARRLGGTSEEMLNLIETMRNDQEALVDQVESLKIRNENLEKITEEKESRFHELTSTAEEANTEYFKIKKEFDKLKHMYDSTINEFNIIEDKLSRESRDKDDLLGKNKKLENEINQLKKHLEHLNKSFNDLCDKKSSEVDALSRELSDYDLRERELKGRIEILERSKFDTEEELRMCKKDLASTKSDSQNIIQIMEQYENEIESYKKRSKQIEVLKEECKKKIEEAQFQKDRLDLKEQQYTSKINKLEEENRYDAKEREDKFNSMIDNLQMKHKLVIDEREAEINDLNKKYSEYFAENEKLRTETDRLRSEVAKLEKAIRESEHQIDKKYDDYERRIRTVNETKDELQRLLENENTKLKSEIETLQYESTSKTRELHDLQNKAETYKSDYEKLVEDFKRTKDNLRAVNDEKEKAELEVNKVRQLYNVRMKELQQKIQKKEVSEKEKFEIKQSDLEKHMKIIKNLEILNEKWRDEHKSTVSYFHKLVLHLNQENQQYKDENLEFKKELKRSGKYPMYPEKDLKSGGRSKSKDKR
jgi:chromosome segregation ATPase